MLEGKLLSIHAWNPLDFFFLFFFCNFHFLQTLQTILNNISPTLNKTYSLLMVSE
jgi:hypothetical protein